MESIQYEYYNPIVPLLNTASRKRITVIPVTTSSARHDLSSLLSYPQGGHLIELTADGCDVYYAFNDSDAGSVDEATQDSTETACAVLFDGAQKVGRLVGEHKWLIVKGSTTGSLRVNIGSLGRGENARDI